MTTTDPAPAVGAGGPIDDAASPSIEEGGQGRRIVAQLGVLLRRYWGTAFVVACVIVAGLSSGALWKSLAEGTYPTTTSPV